MGTLACDVHRAHRRALVRDCPGAGRPRHVGDPPVSGNPQQIAHSPSRLLAHKHSALQFGVYKHMCRRKDLVWRQGAFPRASFYGRGRAPGGCAPSNWSALIAQAQPRAAQHRGSLEGKNSASKLERRKHGKRATVVCFAVLGIDVSGTEHEPTQGNHDVLHARWLAGRQKRVDTSATDALIRCVSCS